MATPFTAYATAKNTSSELTSAILATDALGNNISGITIVNNVVLNASQDAVPATDSAGNPVLQGPVNFYDGSLSGLGIGKGLLLTSGTTPGTVNDIGWFGQSNNGAGDADINAVVNTVFQTQSYDATTLAFDFTVSDVTATSITFDLVMGSDEYPEWVNSFVDSAVVIVNGVNYALFNHNPNNPLSVVSQNLAAGYFQDNANQSLPIQYDGVSQVLKIVAPINAGGALNHIKIGVADTGDHIYDTGLFIANLSAGNAPGSGIVATPSTGTVGDDNFTGSAKDEYFDLKGGDDTVYAGIGDDIIVGGVGNDVIFGGSGNDQTEGDAGDDNIDGGDGLGDTAIYTGIASDYIIAKDASGSFYTVTYAPLNKNTADYGSVDTLKNIEIVKFSDGTVNLTPLAAPAVSTSAPIATVAPAPVYVSVTVVAPPPVPVIPANKAGTVFVGGVGSVGQALTASLTDADGTLTSVINYEWQVSKDDGTTWANILNTDGSNYIGVNYVVTADDAPLPGQDAKIQVIAAYYDDLGNSESIVSASKTILETEKTGDLFITLMNIDAPLGATTKNPLTTLVQNVIELTGVSVTTAAATIKSVLDLPTVDLQHYDAYAILQVTPNDVMALSVEKVAVQAAILTSLADDDSGMKLTSAILDAAKNGQTLDLANADNLATILGVNIAGLTKNTYPQPLKEIFDRNDSMAADIADGKDVNSIEAQWQDMLSVQDLIVSTSISDLSSHINQAPTGSAAAILTNINEDSAAVALIGLLQGFADSDGGTLQVSNLNVDANVGTINGLTFTPKANYNGPVELAYDVVDGQGGGIAASQLFVVKAVNDLPTGGVTISNNTDAARGITLAQRSDELSVANTLGDVDDTSKSVLSYQWQRDGSDISGATGEIYTLVQADVNAVISVVASYVDDQNTTESVGSAVTNAIIPVNYAPTGEVIINNTTNAKQGDTLTVSDTLNDIDGMMNVSVAYHWQDNNGKNIATGSSYTLTQADVGFTLTVSASYTDDLGTLETVASAATNSIINVNDAPAGLATAILAAGTEDTPYTIAAADLLMGFSDVDGDALSVVDLTATNGQLVPTPTGWALNSSVNYNGAVALSYSVIDGNGGSVLGTQDFSLVAVNDLPTGAATITGVAVQGQLLTAGNNLADVDGLGTIGYQWLAGGALINGATANAYTLTQNEVGKTVTVVASYTDKQGAQESVESAATTNVANAPVAVTGTTINGTKGNDKLVGGNGDDSLFGGNGDDKLFGGAGNDWLTGGKGDDFLTGGFGADHFLFVNNNGEDKVLDFNAAQDFIHLAANTGVTAGNLSQHLDAHNGSLEIKFLEGEVTLVGVADLDVSHVVFG